MTAALLRPDDTGVRGGWEAPAGGASEDLSGAVRGINRASRGFAPPAYKQRRIC